MELPNIFKKEVSEKVIERINALTPSSNPEWGKMNVGQMLAHNNVMYEMVYDDKHPKPNTIVKFILKVLVKKNVTGSKPYKKNASTAPAFLIKGDRNFFEEKSRLIDFITKSQKLGEDKFDARESHSFGVLSKNEWNNLFYKHVDHHLTQFGV